MVPQMRFIVTLYLHSLPCFFHRRAENRRASAATGRCVAIDVVRSTPHSPTVRGTLDCIPERAVSSVAMQQYSCERISAVYERVARAIGHAILSTNMAHQLPSSKRKHSATAPCSFFCLRQTL